MGEKRGNGEREREINKERASKKEKQKVVKRKGEKEKLKKQRKKGEKESRDGGGGNKVKKD